MNVGVDIVDQKLVLAHLLSVAARFTQVIICLSDIQFFKKSFRYILKKCILKGGLRSSLSRIQFKSQPSMDG